MSTLGERLKIIQNKSGLQQVQFAQSMGISKETLIYYQKNRRHPNSVFLSNLCKIYKVNPIWLLLGEGEPFIGDEGRSGEKEEKVGAIDPVLLLLKEEQKREGIVLTPKQRGAVLKILREFVYRDMRSIRELMQSMQGEQKGEES
jgi:transcriptional regulator with XRE-family HTH domain